MSSREGSLTSKNISQVLTPVLDWHTLGTNLGLPNHSLGAIRIDYSVNGTDRQRQEMINKWLAFDTGASWSKLARALEEMGENEVAKNIRDTYGCDHRRTQNGASTHSAAATGTSTKTPTKKQLMKLLYKEVADKWRAMGDFLEIPAGTLNIIAEKNGSDPQKCLLHLLDIWLARTEPLPTWSAMADAVDMVSEDSSLVEKVRRMQDN